MATSGYRFEDLELYRAARELRKKIYAFTKCLPPEEKYNLHLQLRRTVLSVTNNIAEGHGRFHYQENIQFLRQSRGSLEELIDDLNLCLDENYCTHEDIENLKIESYEVLKRINGYVAYLRSRKESSASLKRN